MPFTLHPTEPDLHADLDIAREDAVLALWGEPDDGDLIQLDEAPDQSSDLDA